MLVDEGHHVILAFAADRVDRVDRATSVIAGSWSTMIQVSRRIEFDCRNSGHSAMQQPLRFPKFRCQCWKSIAYVTWTTSFQHWQWILKCSLNHRWHRICRDVAQRTVVFLHIDYPNGVALKVIRKAARSLLRWMPRAWRLSGSLTMTNRILRWWIVDEWSLEIVPESASSAKGKENWMISKSSTQTLISELSWRWRKVRRIRGSENKFIFAGIMILIKVRASDNSRSRKLEIKIYLQFSVNEKYSRSCKVHIIDGIYFVFLNVLCIMWHIKL